MDEAVLTSKGRKQLSKSAFAIPPDRYPIHDLAHARNALARVSQHGSQDEKKRVGGCLSPVPGAVQARQGAEDPGRTRTAGGADRGVRCGGARQVPTHHWPRPRGAAGRAGAVKGAGSSTDCWLRRASFARAVATELAEVESKAYPGLERSPKKNWVEQVGGLPSYIERVAKHLHYEKGYPISRGHRDGDQPRQEDVRRPAARSAARSPSVARPALSRARRLRTGRRRRPARRASRSRRQRSRADRRAVPGDRAAIRAVRPDQERGPRDRGERPLPAQHRARGCCGHSRTATRPPGAQRWRPGSCFSERTGRRAAT